MEPDKRLRIYIALVESIDILTKWTQTTEDYRYHLYERLNRLQNSLGWHEMKHWIEGMKK